MFSSLRKLTIYRVFLAWAFLAIATVPLNYQAYADEAETGGQSDGSGDGGGNGSTAADVSTESASTAESTGNHAAEAVTDTSAEVSVVQGSSDVGTGVQVKTSAEAKAKSDESKLEASAKATVSDTAGAVENASTAGAGTNAESEAYAISTKKGSEAYAASGDGAYAYANTSTGLSPIAYVPEGQTKTIHHGKTTVAIAYTELGTFSMASTNGRTAKAMTGSTENAKALASGNIKAIIRSATFASAEASPLTAYAFASATVDGMAQNAAGYARAEGHSWAFARVTRTGSTLQIAVATADGINQCGSHWWLKKIKRKECQVQIRIVKMK